MAAERKSLTSCSNVGACSQSYLTIVTYLGDGGELVEGLGGHSKVPNTQVLQGAQCCKGHVCGSKE